MADSHGGAGINLAPPDIIAERIDEFAILQSMYPLDDELEILESFDSVENVLSHTTSGKANSARAVAILTTQLSDDVNAKLKITLDLTGVETASSSENASKAHVWNPVGISMMSIEPQLPTRAVYDQIQQAFSKYRGSDAAVSVRTTLSEQVMNTVEQLRSIYAEYGTAPAGTRLPVNEDGTGKETSLSVSEVQLLQDFRIFFYFPSLHTPAKRKDLVMYARDRGLTGFVLAGKPGLLCVEGPDSVIEEYMSSIKAESWGDIPSYQKKVTERHREPISSRAFSSMDEITDSISQRGERGDRGDMKQVRDYLQARGLQASLPIVLGMGGT